MGTNYYVEHETCQSCNHKPDDLHIGKSSSGWVFLLHVTEHLDNWQKWKDYLLDKKIIDEYDRPVTYNDMISIVENRDAYRANNVPMGKGYYLDFRYDLWRMEGREGDGPYDYLAGEFC